MAVECLLCHLLLNKIMGISKLEFLAYEIAAYFLCFVCLSLFTHCGLSIFVIAERLQCQFIFMHVGLIMMVILSRHSLPSSEG